MELGVFLLFALLALASAGVVVTHRNPVYSTMSLVVTLVSLAVLFVMLGAPFVATLQVLVYTGAILVLFLFVIMLLNVGRQERDPDDGQRGQRWGAILGGGIFAGTIGATLWKTYRGVTVLPLSEETVALKPLAQALFDRYLLAFEAVGLLLLVAVVAATAVARRLPLGEAVAERADATPVAGQERA
jgi:NADH-quinone oxidoreductase subunit J